MSGVQAGIQKLTTTISDLFIARGSNKTLSGQMPCRGLSRMQASEFWKLELRYHITRILKLQWAIYARLVVRGILRKLSRLERTL